MSELLSRAPLARAACALALAAPATVLAMSAAGASDLRRHDFRVQSAPGIQLAVREVVAPRAMADSGLAVILLHGARVPGPASFDLPVPGGSLAADLARAGHRVYIPDVRGYGASSRPGQDGPPDGRPSVRSEDVMEDLDAVIGAVRARAPSARLALLGWATGGHWAGMYASRHPGRIDRVVIYNSLYGAHAGHASLGPGSETSDPGDPARFNVARFGAYRLNTAPSLLPAWDRSIPTQDKSLWRDPAVAKAYQDAAIASDPRSHERSPPAFRAPSGAMADSFELASGRKLWDAAAVRSHVLVIRSGNDFWSRPEDLDSLARELVQAASVRAITIPSATHFVHLDRDAAGRATFWREVRQFLAAHASANH